MGISITIGSIALSVALRKTGNHLEKIGKKFEGKCIKYAGGGLLDTTAFMSFTNVFIELNKLKNNM